MDNRFAFMMHTLNNNNTQAVESSSRQDSVLTAMSFQLQQQNQQLRQQQDLIKVLLTSQQFITSQLQLALAAQGSSHPSSTSVPPTFVPPTFMPSASASPTASTISSSVSPCLLTSRPPTPLRIRPTSSLVTNTRRVKGKGKAKDISFIPYQPEP